jgi:hypothetical protein
MTINLPNIAMEQKTVKVFVGTPREMKIKVSVPMGNDYFVEALMIEDSTANLLLFLHKNAICFAVLVRLGPDGYIIVSAAPGWERAHRIYEHEVAYANAQATLMDEIQLIVSNLDAPSDTPRVYRVNVT